MQPNRFGRKRVHLFVFSRQNLVWRYCTADRALVVDGKVYTSAQIERGDIKQTAERAKDKLSIKCAYLLDPSALEYPSTQPLGDNWFPTIPSDPVTVVCLGYDAGEGNAPTVEWMGEVTQPKFTDTELELLCEPTNGLGRARGQGMKWQRTCGKTPYSTGIRGCNLDAALYEVNGVVTSVTTAGITVAEFASAPFPLGGGYITWARPNGIIERRSITGHAGDTVALMFGADGLAVGAVVSSWPTCPRTWSACLARDNTLNYGGSIYKPVKNPLDGVSMSWG
ncbi:phage BR0599 family protein [Stenotrophomonas terrae]|uniref:phage BR0599 family protein n=1 Tax=Stenotrophomonas terrae TaxID=405446 RepID=UPI00320A66B5